MENGSYAKRQTYVSLLQIENGSRRQNERGGSLFAIYWKLAQLRQTCSSVPDVQESGLSTFMKLTFLRNVESCARRSTPYSLAQCINHSNIHTAFSVQILT
jgi:hypothetical protein